MSNKTQLKKENRFVIMIAIGIVITFAIIITLVIKFKKSNVVTSNERGNVVIDTTELTSKGKYYTYLYDGAEMEFFAVRDKYGKVRMAFNRCQVCFDSGRGYFVQEGEEFVCQNCGNRYNTISIGNEKGGCNPSPIMKTDIIVDGEIVEIKERIFEENKYLFV